MKLKVIIRCIRTTLVYFHISVSFVIDDNPVICRNIVIDHESGDVIKELEVKFIAIVGP